MDRASCALVSGGSSLATQSWRAMPRRIIVVGADGLLGSCFTRRLSGDGPGSELHGLDLPAFDVSAPMNVRDAVRGIRPDLVLNCSAISDVDLCEREPSRPYAVHRDGVAHLACELAADSGASLLVTFSTDQVFDNDSEEPIMPGSKPDPVNAYARSKAEGERAALLLAPGNVLVVRTSWLFGGSRGMVPRFWRVLSEGREVGAVADQVSCITYAEDLVDAVLEAVDSGFRGLVHMAGQGCLTPYELARTIAGLAGADPGLIRKRRWSDLQLDARRPSFSVLGGPPGSIVLPGIEQSITRWRGDFGQ